MSETKLIDIKELKFDEHNFNRHNDEGMSLLEKSIKENGLGRSILLDKDNNIVGGNGVTEKAIELGKTKVRIIETDGSELIAVKRTDLTLDSEQGRKMALADNSVAHANLEWNEEELQKAQDEWGLVPEEWGVEMPDFGLSDEQAVETVEEDNFEIEDDIEKKVNVGDIWQLGRHRLMCGDSTDAEDVARLMNGERADIAFTSPPYNAGSINQADNPRTHAKYGEYDDNKTSAEYLDFIKTNVGLLLDHCDEVFYNIGLVSGNKKEIFQLINIYLDKFKDMLYWRKSNCAPCIQAGVINNLVEFIIAFGNNGSRKFKNPQFSQGSYYNVIEGKNASDNEYASEHKATFPVYLPAEFIKSFTPANGSVLDCFGGTGTTMIAAEQLGRKCFMMELDPHYCTIIIARWEKLTGQKAIKLNP